MIIAVNIRRALAKGMPVQKATERAWALKRKNCEQHEYVIAVVNGIIKGYYKLIKVKSDHEFTLRVKFDLDVCSDVDKEFINRYIVNRNINLRRVQRGKYI